MTGIYAANGFLHDLSVGLALAFLVAAWLIGREAAAAAEAAEALGLVRRTFLRAAVAALVAIAATGVVRTLGYRAGFEGPATWTGTLFAKHLVLLGVFGGVAALGLRYARRAGS